MLCDQLRGLQNAFQNKKAAGRFSLNEKIRVSAALYLRLHPTVIFSGWLIALKVLLLLSTCSYLFLILATPDNTHYEQESFEGSATEVVF